MKKYFSMLLALMLLSAASVMIMSCGDEDNDVIPADTHDYVNLGLPSGTLWATCNVGANRPEEVGGYFAWGETTTKENYDWITYQWTEGSSETPTKYMDLSSEELELADDAAYANWGKYWRMPSKEQFEELINSSYTTTQLTTQNGVYGCLITSLANGKSIFLPMTGYWKYFSPNNAETNGYYWSRTSEKRYLKGARTLVLLGMSDIPAGINERFYTGVGNRSFGYCVRPVRASK